MGIEKDWWSPELDDLKQQCIEITNVWRYHGCPRTGEINNKRIRIKLKYKCAIKEAIMSVDKEFNVNLTDHLCKKEFHGFWKSRRKRFCSKNLITTNRLNNRTGDDNILDEFSKHFSEVYQCNTAGSDDKYKTFVMNYLDSNTNSKDCKFPTYCLWYCARHY